MEIERVSTLQKEEHAIASIQISFLKRTKEMGPRLPDFPIHKWGGITTVLEIEQIG